jgi:hypothetical protein
MKLSSSVVFATAGFAVVLAAAACFSLYGQWRFS